MFIIIVSLFFCSLVSIYNILTHYKRNTQYILCKIAELRIILREVNVVLMQCEIELGIIVVQERLKETKRGVRL